MCTRLETTKMPTHVMNQPDTGILYSHEKGRGGSSSSQVGPSPKMRPGEEARCKQWLWAVIYLKRNILEEDTRLGEQWVFWVGPCTPSALPRAVPCEVLAVPKSLF